MPRIPLLCSAVALAGLSACTLGPDYKRPTVDAPPAFGVARPSPAASAPVRVQLPVSTPSERLARADAALAAVPPPTSGGKELLDTSWWSSFGDPVLDGLVTTALEQNQDLRIAALRIEQFDAYLQISKSAGLPQAGYRAERTRDTLSANRQVPLAVGVQPVDNNFLVSATASWELDLWGKISRSNEAAYADLVASEETRRALSQSLVSEVASTYIRLRTLDRELELLQVAVESNREAVRLAEAAFADGGNSELPVLHALAELQQRQADVPAKEVEIAVLENALSSLLGSDPKPIPRGKPAYELLMPKVPGGLPVDLLMQRPDLRRAEQELVSANAKIGVAKAQYLPTISLTASSGFASNQLNNLALLTSNFGSFGATLLGPLFTAGRISGQVREAEAVQKQAEIAYVRAMQTAVREVDDALTAHRQLNVQGALRKQQVAALQEQHQLARKRFENGYTSYFPVLDAEQALTAGLLLQNESRREDFKALIAVYKAMGGGWALPDVTAPRANPPKINDE